MSALLANITNSLLPQLDGSSDQEKWEACAKDFPWYAMPWVALAKNGESSSKQKAAVWMEDEQRLHWLLTATPFASDIWIAKNLESTDEEITTLPVLPVETVTVKELEPTEIFLTEKDEAIEPFEKAHIEDENTSVKFTLTGFQADETTEEEDANDTDFVGELEKDIIPLHNNLTNYTDNQFIEKNTDVTAENSQIVPTTITTETIVVAEAVENSSNTEEPEDIVVAIQQAKETVLQSATLPETKSVAEPLAFEPYHVVDYFASQGIKVDINDLPKTQLDRQMKSFTQWLKTMKKVAPQETTDVTDPIVDAHATSSLIKEDVITEAMAEVLEKQGMHKKAVEVYEKLILLHPEKSTFFAARIKDLKSK